MWRTAAVRLHWQLSGCSYRKLLMPGRGSCFLVLGTLLACLLASCKAFAPAGLLSNIRLLRRKDK